MTKKLIVTSAAIFALGAGALGYAQLAAADGTTSPTPSVTTSAQPGKQFDNRGKFHHRGGLGAYKAQLASKLGVDEAKLTEAVVKVRQALRQEYQDAATKPDPATVQGEFVKALAKELGLDQAKVKTAIDEIRADNKEQREVAFKSKLDEAVSAGKLTQAEADAVLKAAKEGVISMRMGPRGR